MAEEKSTELSSSARLMMPKEMTKFFQDVEVVKGRIKRIREAAKTAKTKEMVGSLCRLILLGLHVQLTFPGLSCFRQSMVTATNEKEESDTRRQMKQVWHSSVRPPEPLSPAAPNIAMLARPRGWGRDLGGPRSF